MRVISLLASATEIVCALDAGDLLVGRSHECDNPAWVRQLPACSEPTFDISVSSGDIDREVSRRIRSGEPLYRIDTARIRDLAPDLLIAQSHCEVCAVTPRDIGQSSTPVLSLSAGSLEDIFTSIVDIARALGIEQRGHALVQRERARLDFLRARTSGLRRPSVVMLEWTDPIYPMANWGPELVDTAGGELALGKNGQHSSAISSEQVRTADPEYLVVAPCGFNLERAGKELAVLQRYPWWTELRAVRAGKVAFADGNLFFNRSGMTATQTAEIVAEMLHGVLSGTPAEGTHWRWMRHLRQAGVSAA